MGRAVPGRLGRDAGKPGVTAFTHIRSEMALVQGVERQVTGIDPATIAQFYRFDWTTGSARTLTSSATTARS